jgi:predicted restriction endonuclease
MFAEIAGNLTSGPHYQIKGKTANYVKFGKCRTFPLNPVLMESMLKSKSLSKTLKYIRKSHQSPTRLSASDWKFLIAEQKRVNKKVKLKGVTSADQRKTSEDNEEKRISRDYANKPTQRKALVNARSGQGRYRSELIKREKRCRITGIADKSFLVASHIKPWALSNDQEKLDSNNGLLLTPNLDRAFDRGLISFSSTGKILISKRLSVSVSKVLGINSTTHIGALNFAQQKYLKFHREKVFK